MPEPWRRRRAAWPGALSLARSADAHGRRAGAWGACARARAGRFVKAEEATTAAAHASRAGIMCSRLPETVAHAGCRFGGGDWPGNLSSRSAPEIMAPPPTISGAGSLPRVEHLRIRPSRRRRRGGDLGISPCQMPVSRSGGTVVSPCPRPAGRSHPAAARQGRRAHHTTAGRPWRRGPACVPLLAHGTQQGRAQVDQARPSNMC